MQINSFFFKASVCWTYKHPFKLLALSWSNICPSQVSPCDVLPRRTCTAHTPCGSLPYCDRNRHIEADCYALWKQLFKKATFQEANRDLKWHLALIFCEVLGFVQLSILSVVMSPESLDGNSETTCLVLLSWRVLCKIYFSGEKLQK